MVSRLGSEQFVEREQAEQELQRIGQAALLALRVAEKHTDLEIARRAQSLVVRLEREGWVNPEGRVPFAHAAIRLLLQRKSDSAPEILLRYLAVTRDPGIEEEIYYGLDELRSAGLVIDPMLERALSSPRPAQRAVAACLLGRVGNLSQKGAVRKCLADENPMVRLRAAQGLLASQQREALPVLISLLSQTSIEITWQAEELLHYAAGDDAPKEVIGISGEKERATCRKLWERWWNEKADKLDLAQIAKGPRRPGLLLYSTHEKRNSREEVHGRLWVCGCDGGARYQRKLKRGLSVPRWHPKGRIVGCSSTDDGNWQVMEQDLSGNIIWQRQYETGFSDIRLMPDGGCVACSNWYWIELNKAGGQVRLSEKIKAHRLMGVKLGWDGSLRGLEMLDLPGTQVVVPSGTTLIARLKAICPETGEARCQTKITARTIYRGPKLHQAVAQLDISLQPVALLRNGNTLMQAAYWRAEGKEIEHHRTWALWEFDPDGRMVWQRYGEWEGQVAEVIYPLVRFGFSRPRTELMDLNTPSARVKALASRDVLLRRYSIEHLMSRYFRSAPPDEVVGGAISALSDSDGYVRESALWLVMPAAARAQAGIPGLIAMLEDQHAHNKFKAAEVLARVGKQAIVPLIAATKNRNGRHAYERRAIAFHALASFASAGDEKAIAAIRTGFADGDIKIRVASIEALGHEANRAGAFIVDLVRLSDDRDVRVRKASIQSLGAMGSAARSALPHLRRKLEDSAIRLAAIQALARIGKDDPETLTALRCYLNPRHDFSTCKASIDALLEFGAKKEVVAALCEALGDTRKAVIDHSGMNHSGRPKPVRFYATIALGQLGPSAKRSVPDLVRIVKDRGELDVVRLDALSALAHIDPRAANNARPYFTPRPMSEPTDR